MSYPKDLDEMDEIKLADEVERRRQTRAAGLCDYCGRKPDTDPCKFPDRHRAAGGPNDYDERWEVDEPVNAIRIDQTPDGVEEVVTRRRLLKVKVMTPGLYRASPLQKKYPAPLHAQSVVVIYRDRQRSVCEEDLEGTPTFLTNSIQVLEVNVASRIEEPS